MQRRGIELKGDQLPISALVRRPLLAIRWQLPDQKVGQHQKCCTLVLCFTQIRRLQLRFRSNEDFDVVYDHLQRLGLRMMLSHTQSKDGGSTTKSEQSKAGPRPPSSPSRSEAERTGPSCPPSRLSEITSRPYTAVTAASALKSRGQEAIDPRPTSAFAGTGLPSLNPLTPPMYFPRPESASVVSPDCFPTSSPREQSMANIEHDITTSRPETAMLFERPDTAELPPRRELPFRRDSLPTSSGSDNNRPHSRPSTGFMGPPPLPSRVSDLRPGSARAAGLDSELPPLRQPTLVAETTKKPQSEQRPHTPRPSSKGHAKSVQATTTYKDLEASSSPQAYRTSATVSPLAPHFLSPISSAVQTRHPFVSPTLSTSPDASGSKVHIDRASDPIPSTHGECALKAYATQSDEVRRAALNSFILKNLDNNDFLTLVEDMEINWARIGLGTW